MQEQWPQQIRQQRALARVQKRSVSKVAGDSKAPLREGLISESKGVAKLAVEPAVKPTVVLPLVERAGSREADGKVAEKKGWQPGPEHPWKRMKLGRALYLPNPHFLNAKN